MKQLNAKNYKQSREERKLIQKRSSIDSLDGASQDGYDPNTDRYDAQTPDISKQVAENGGNGRNPDYFIGSEPVTHRGITTQHSKNVASATKDKSDMFSGRNGPKSPTKGKGTSRGNSKSNVQINGSVSFKAGGATGSARGSLREPSNNFRPDANADINQPPIQTSQIKLEKKSKNESISKNVEPKQQIQPQKLENKQTKAQIVKKEEKPRSPSPQEPPQRTMSMKQIMEQRDPNSRPDKGGLTRQYTSRRERQIDYEDEDDDDGAASQYEKTQVIAVKDTQGNVVSQVPNEKFKSYRKIFSNLLKHNSVVTMYPIVSMNIAYDSSRVLTVTKKNDCESWVKMYSLKDFKLTFEEKVGGDESQYIKIQEIEQNSNGSQFAFVFSDDGKFRMRVFGRETRTEEEIENTEIRINEMFDIDTYTMTNDDFQDPFINCCFVNDEKIFVAFFHNYSRTHYHFMWDIAGHKVIEGKNGVAEPIKRVLDCGLKNFPYKSFYYEERDECYTFYRTGDAFTIKQSDISDYRHEIITDKELGQMVLIYGKALVARSSSSVLFFKQVWNEMTEGFEWKLYYTIKERGFIYFMKGNVRIQVTTDKLIYFYLIDQEDLMPNLENVMYNYMGCNQMMFGRMVRNGVTYKTNQRSFDVYQRQSMHNLKVCVQAGDYEGSKGLEISTSNVFLVTKIDQILMFDCTTFQQVGKIPIQLLVTETRERNEIIGIEKSIDENWLAVISGKNLVMNEQSQNQLFVFKRVRGSSPQDYDQFVLHKRIRVKEMEIFKKVTMQYMFKNFSPDKEPDSIIFARADMIFELNYMNDPPTSKAIYELGAICSLQPSFFVSNPDQTRFIMASSTDGQYIDIKRKKEVDLDELHNIRDIRHILYDEEDKMFYFLCGKKNGIIGFFLVSFNESDPHDYKYLTMWRHQLDIDDAHMAISRGTDKDGPFKELIISYKTIYINTFTVVTKDLSDDSDNIGVLSKHESFQLWESNISGMLLTDSKDFLSFSKAGINILALGQVPKRKLVDNEGQSKVIHSLDSLSFLKVDKTNYMNFKCQEYSNRVISIEQEHSQVTKGDKQAVNHSYYDIYKIKIHEVTLRELLILQSLYLCKTPTEISDLVTLQPKPMFFYKSFLEFDGANIVSILAFDSRSVASLLSEENSDYFSEEYPVIYKNKVLKKSGQDYFITSAIDIALKNNQIQAVNSLLKYIKQFQNNYVSSYMFLRTFPILMDKGIELTELLDEDSKIFTVNFDFDGWPGNHYNDEEGIRPYNGSYFDIRDSYREVFPEDDFDDENMEDKQDVKFYKIKYSVNLLCQVNMFVFNEDGQNEEINDEVSLMDMASQTEELSLVITNSFGDIIDYKWDTYGRRHHFLGLAMHLFYVTCFTLYVIKAYLQNIESIVYLILLIAGIIYPSFYEFAQMYQQGSSYLQDAWNYTDVAYYAISYLNIALQIILGPISVTCKICMSIIVVFLIIKTFFFLRIFPTLTPIIVMLKNVVYDLRIFLFFYMILITLFSQLLAIIGLGNDYSMQTEEMLDENGVVMLGEDGEPIMVTIQPEVKVDPTVDTENNAIGLHFGVWEWTLRLSMGDSSAIGYSHELTPAENWIFWFIWFLITIVTCIIFLNFIVAEASASYTKVVEALDEFIAQEKAALIFESESMSLRSSKNNTNYPRYLIKREIDS